MALYKHKMEKALRESEQKYRSMVQSSPDHIFLINTDGVYIESNESVEQFGLASSKSLVGSHITDVYPQDIAGFYQKQIEKVITSAQSISFEHPMTITGEMKHHLDILYPVFVDDTIWAVGGLCRDITQRVVAEKALATEKEQLLVTLRSIGDAIISADLDGRVLLLNDVAEKLTGWAHREAVGKPVHEVFKIINEKTREKCEDPVKKVLETGKIIGLANDTVLISKGGQERIIADSGAPVKDIEGKIIGVVLVFRDITERLKLEGQLRQAQKVEALGTLAGGIAHD
ncbi:MAG: PAS domain-containing protein, partial [Deltaproteobacteria bacterium]|nr:PAS domain-containing protein [Deltaproteobacteria bacterium]